MTSVAARLRRSLTLSCVYGDGNARQFEIDFRKGTVQPGSIRHPFLNCVEFEYRVPKHVAVRAVRLQMEGVTTLVLRSVEVSRVRGHYIATALSQTRSCFVGVPRAHQPEHHIAAND